MVGPAVRVAKPCKRARAFKNASPMASAVSAVRRGTGTACPKSRARAARNTSPTRQAEGSASSWAEGWGKGSADRTARWAEGLTARWAAGLASRRASCWAEGLAERCVARRTARWAEGLYTDHEYQTRATFACIPHTRWLCACFPCSTCTHCSSKHIDP